MGQLFIDHLFGGSEVFLLVVMAYDRCVAICKPLHYLTIMNRQVCILLLVVAVTGGLCVLCSKLLLCTVSLSVAPMSLTTFSVTYTLYLELACTDTYFIGLTAVFNGGAMRMVILTLLLVFYGVILNSFKTYSQEGRHKALSTCSSHITVVAMFFVPCIFIYVRPVSNFLLINS